MLNKNAQSSPEDDSIGRLIASVQSSNPYDETSFHLPPVPPRPTDESAAGYATYEFRRVLAKIEQAQDEQALFWIASSAFGPNNFFSRFGEALGAFHGQQYLALQKQIMLALLEDHLSSRTEWPRGGPRSLGFSGPELWEVGYHLRFARINLICDQGALKKAVELRDALLSELSILFETSTKIFVEARNRLNPQARAHWTRYLEKVKLPNSQADAGWSFGSLLAQVLNVFGTMLKREDFSGDLMKNAPALARCALAPGQ